MFNRVVSIIICWLIISGAVQNRTACLFATNWYIKESKHFEIIYRQQHAHLSNHILDAGERALEPLMDFFEYTPTEKIIINTYDFSDYGKAGTTTLPQNFIRLEIAPLELSYETMPFNERIQWIISHELVHVIVNDLGTGLESFSRKIFSKVPPESDQPLTVFYSYLTNPRRFTPRWHQEGIAIFMETWLSGGYGRVLGNFDEMYFRSMVLENNKFPPPQVLESVTSHNSFLLETLFYLYGSRFSAFLAQKYSVQKLLDWYKIPSGSGYSSYTSKFKNVFGISFYQAWDDFERQEIVFQKKNISKISEAHLTKLDPLRIDPLGWVTPAYYEVKSNSVIFGYHKPHQLTAIARYHLESHKIEKLGSLPTPSMIDIASTAHDDSNNLLFYTTNNNKLFRDIHVLNTRTGNEELLFKDCRVGQLTISPQTREIFGIRHEGGRTVLVHSAYPYNELIPIINFGVEVNLQHLAVSPSGKYLAATLHKNNGSQTIILSDLNVLKKTKKFTFSTLYADGSPEHPSWSPDEQFIYWSAYTNGVSNIYRYRLQSAKTEPLSNTLRGLFRPLQVNQDSIFAFEFTSEGFQPVILPNKPAEHLPATDYFGQKILDNNPDIRSWPLSAETFGSNSDSMNTVKTYRALRNLKTHSLVPVLSGFQGQQVVGIFSHIADPLYIHDLSFEIGITPYPPNSVAPRFHFNGKYEYRRRIKIGIEHNASNFFDLVNDRKRGMIGNRITFTHTKFWKYDIPHKIKQVSEVAIYSGIEAINDNLVRVSSPDFLVMQSALTSSDTRRAIGSVNAEKGLEWSVTGMFFGVEPKDIDVVGGGHAEMGYYFPWLKPHNILHTKIAGGYRYTKENMAIGRFYFGGFGNRHLEKDKVKQYRKTFRFPGIPIYSLDTDRFIKVMVEHNLPPFRPAKASLGDHYVSHFDLSWYTQGLLVKQNTDNYWVNSGVQFDINFKHWYNLDSTLSFGFAKAWSRYTSGDEWFASLKLFRK